MGQRIVPVTMGSPRFHTAELDGLRVTEAEFAPGDVLPPHVHDRTVVAVMLEGAFDLEIRGAASACTPGTVFVEPGGERHANRIGNAGARVLVLEPTPLFERDRLGPCRELLDGPAVMAHPSAAEVARRLRHRLSAGNEVAVQEIEALAIELIGAAADTDAARDPVTPPDWALRALEIVHETPLQPLRVSEIAAEVGVHPVYLTRVFRLCFGTSLGTYQRQRRLEWAAGRLRNSDEPVAAIAARAGFADQAHFTRTFKRFSGFTPARYRRHSTARRRQRREPGPAPE